jgi:hypothetical protein
MVCCIDVDADACCVRDREGFCHVRPNPLTGIAMRVHTRDLVLLGFRSNDNDRVREG